jgi:tRNA 2-thiouridine synthesizing protein C
MANSQSMLFLSRHAPYAYGLSNSYMDILLTAAAFDQDVTLVYSEDGVYQLLKNQDSEDIGLKDISKSLPALELYEVTKVFVEQEALDNRGINLDDLVIPVQIINNNDLADLLESVDQVFNF